MHRRAQLTNTLPGTSPSRTARRPKAVAAAATAALAAALTLSACGGGTDAAGATPAAPTTTAPAAPSTPADAASPLTIEDAWVKTAPEGMTAAFGVLRNTSDADVVVTGGSTPAASMVELHEVVMKDGAMTMQPKAGGFVVPAGGTHELAPGADHIMVMGLTAPLVAGDPVEVTLTYDGGTFTFDALAKDFAGANETYAP